tara:strand:+ start:952 stop:1971 length:1020 start_codon:yes stop_codon:yes gene_type:complete
VHTNARLFGESRDGALRSSITMRAQVLRSLAPVCPTLADSQFQALISHCRTASRLLCISGAGISTHSGIPDYRSPSGSYSRGHKPMQHMEFIKSAKNRQRYWARSFVGWQYFSRAQPNAAHKALVELEAAGWLQGGIVTQNVDGLHSAAGSQRCIDLHGRIDAVHCQSCGHLSPRAELQARLEEANHVWAHDRSLANPKASTPTELRADGDLELSDADVQDFEVPSCLRCGDGVLKPHVTFFGGSVPAESVEAAADAVADADAVLVVGSSLQVFSAFRLVRAASQASLPIAILNVGPTRADDLSTLRIAADAADVLPRLARTLGARYGEAPSSGLRGFY